MGLHKYMVILGAVDGHCPESEIQNVITLINNTKIVIIAAIFENV